MTYKIAVCDDEQIFIDDITANLKNQDSEYKIEEFNSGEALLESTLDYNIIFLDIEMTGIDGMETAFALREKKYDNIIIFLTSHAEFMPDAFKVKAFRFLSKPVDPEKFEEALSFAKKEIINTEHIIIETKSSAVYLKLTDITYLEAYGDGTYIYDKNQNVYDSGCSLKYWKDKIGSEHFFQIHKGIIVSFLYTSNVSKKGTVRIRNSAADLPVSRRNITPFKNAFLDYIKKYARVM